MSGNTERSEFELTQELISKSEDEFEKKIIYIAAGALVLSLTFIEKVAHSGSPTGRLFLFLSWIFLIICIMVNLVSHLVVKVHLRRVQKEISDNLNYEMRTKNHNIRIFISECFNWTSVVTLIIGIAMILLFASYNTLQSQTKSNQYQSNDTITLHNY